MKDKLLTILNTAAYCIAVTSAKHAGLFFFCTGLITMQGISYLIDAYTLLKTEAGMAANQVGSNISGLKIKGFAQLFIIVLLLYFNTQK